MPNSPQTVPQESNDWSTLSLGELTGHIVDTHHAYLREHLTRVERQVDLIEKVHGSLHPELTEVAATFRRLKSALEAHIDKEEQAFFPYCEALEAGSQEGTPEWLAQRLMVHQGEHGEVLRLFSTLRRLTAGYAVPDDACGTYEMTLEDLAALEEDTQLHIHKENEILFVRAMELISAR